MRNNYNTSSSGIDIEASISLDGFMSQENFQENFVQIESGILKGKWMYVDFGNLFYTAKRYDIDLKNPEISELIEVEDTKYNRVIMTKYLVDEGVHEYYYCRDNFTINNLLEEIDGNFDEVMDILDELKISYKQKYVEGSTQGYSQGDYAEYVYLPDLLRECWGSPEDIPDEELVGKEWVDNLFWDSPMCVRIVVNGEDYYSEKFDGMYQNWKELEYSKEEVVEEFLEMVMNDQKDLDREVLRRELEEVIPYTLEYIYILTKI